MITTIIFDLDGTLLNTLDDLHASVTYALRELGLPQLPKMATRRYLGNGVKNLVWKCVEHVDKDAQDELKDKALAFFRNYYMQHSMDMTRPFDGVMEMLSECKKSGMMTAIVSNKLDAAVKDLHKQFFADLISLAIGETADVKRKPAPDMVDEAVKQLSLKFGVDISKEECVYVGDSEVDIETAKNAGMKCVAVSWGFRDKDWLEQCGAEVIIDDSKELLEVL